MQKYYYHRTKKQKKGIVHAKQKVKAKTNQKNATLAMNEWRHFKVTFM